MTVLRRIRRARQKANLTQVQLGKMLGCSSSTVSCTKVVSVLRYSNAGQACRCFDVSVDFVRSCMIPSANVKLNPKQWIRRLVGL